MSEADQEWVQTEEKIREHSGRWGGKKKKIHARRVPTRHDIEAELVD